MITRLNNWITAGLLVLVAVMPFHAFLSVWAGSIIGHGAIVQSWKEILLVVLGIMSGMSLIYGADRASRWRHPVVITIGVFFAISLLVTVITLPGLRPAIFGIKTDLEFLFAFLLAWSIGQRSSVKPFVTAILIGSIVVIGFGLLETFILPANFLTHFGYGPQSVLPYETITRGIDNLRFPSTLGGPNQLATYLILPLCLALALAIARGHRRLLWILPAGLIVLFATYSRSGWIGAVIAMVITVILLSTKVWRKRFLIGAAVMLIVAGLTIPLLIKSGGPLQYILLHSSVATHGDLKNSSDAQHASSLRDGIDRVDARPLGHGLGTAGPATFHAGTPNIIENYYLQLGYEVGVTGMLVFIIIVALLARSLVLTRDPVATAIAASLVGISTTSLVLPAWTDSSTALIVWILAGIVMGGFYRHPAETSV